MLRAAAVPCRASPSFPAASIASRRRRASGAGGKRQQAGIALLAMLVLLTLWGLYLFIGQLDTTQLRLANEQRAAAALADAREALVGRAATDDNRPGSLPCPALDENGVAAIFAGNHCPTYIGRLPWSTLRVGELRDSAGALLWYALAPALRDHPLVPPINAQTPVELTLNGTANVAAIVFSPGEPLPTQAGRPGNATSDYLDGSNNDGDNAYVSGPSTPLFNDRALAITRDDVFRAVNQRVLAEIRGPEATPPQWGLRKYFADNGTFPWADTDGDGHADIGAASGGLPYNDLVLVDLAATVLPLPPLGWLSANGWLPLVVYERLSGSSARITIGNSTRDIGP
ncbi:MAG: hypothetical protein KDI53_04380 [Candidatus Accumulibacter sp.]|nr:hypothetical protein [Accumulibacter sp.]